LAAWLRPDPRGELKRSPRPPSHNKGGLLLKGGEGRGGGKGMRIGRGGKRGLEGREGEGREGKGAEEKEGRKGDVGPQLKFDKSSLGCYVCFRPFCPWETAVDSELGVSVSAFRLISLLFKQLIQLMLPLVRGSFARRRH